MARHPVQLGQLAQLGQVRARLLLLLLQLLACGGTLRQHEDGGVLRIPDDFMLGVGSSSYQIEGGWNVNGKGVSTLDRAYGNRSDGGGNVACDSYTRYKEDVAMLKLMGVSHYRFSIAWSRLLPTGEGDNVNMDGVRYYSAILDELEDAGIEPLVTLYHMDIPAVLDDRFGGWVSPKMVGYFETYAVTAFKHFGDRVRFWVTFNEPYMFCVFGHGHGRLGATRVNPGTSEYLCGHHILLAHARAYRAYQQSFSHQGGKVGLTLEDFYTVPDSEKAEDVLAAEVHQQFQLGWFLDPILAGDYPELMRQRVGANGAAGGGRAASRLPTFTEAERRLLSGALDFLGLNVYFGWRARHGVPVGAADPSVERDAAYTIIGTADQFLPPGPFRSTPWAVRRSLGWLRMRYGSELPIIITENGFGDNGAEGLQDEARIGYLQDHLREVMRAVHEDRHNVKGYFVWCLLDDFEWGAGYKSKFGLVHVDFESGTLNRTPKASLLFYKRVIEHRMLADDAVATGPSSSSSSSSRPFDVRMLVVALLGSILCARA